MITIVYSEFCSKTSQGLCIIQFHKLYFVLTVYSVNMATVRIAIEEEDNEDMETL